jgi:ATP-binding cassette, subfamily C, bacteriocin exporter
MKYIHTVQLEKNDCGLACASSVLKYFGNNKGISYLRDRYLSKERYNLKDIIKILNSIGKIESRPVQINLDKLEEVFKEINSPCIAHVNLEENEPHYIIIYKVKKNKLLISDPRKKKIMNISIDDFKKISSGVLLITENPKNIILNKKNNYKSEGYSFFLNLFKSNLFMISIIFVLSLLFVILAVLNSFFFKLVTDYIIPKKLDSALLTFSFVFIGVGVIRGAVDYLRTWFIIKISNKVNVFLSKEYFKKISKLPIKFFENRKDGEIISRFHDAGHITNTISTSVVSAILDSVIIIGLGFILYRVNELLFLTVLVLLITLACLTIFFYESLEKKNRMLMEHEAETNSFLVQFIKNMPTIFAFNKTKYFLETFEKVYQNQIKANLQEKNTVNTNISIKNIVQSSASIFIIWIGSKQIISDSMTLGDLLFVNSLVLFLMGSLEGLIKLQSSLQKAKVAMERYFDILHYPIDQNDNVNAKLKKITEISINNLDYSYNGDINILEKVYLNINVNEKVLFVGESGSGKSTLSKLLSKFYETNNNQIFINGTDINLIDNEVLRDKLIYINENPFIFNATILENLRMGKDFSSEEILAACKIANIDELIYRFPNKLDFKLSEGGVNLSTGQKQRLSLARAILHKPDVLILDESLSNVDPENFRKIYENLLSINCIVILITHSFENFLEYDKKYTFNKGGKVKLTESIRDSEKYLEVIGK